LEKTYLRVSIRIPKKLEFVGADPGFFLGGDAPLRNGVTDW